MERAQLVATLADSPFGRDNIPLLPGLAPGTLPDDPVAYRLWVEEYDSPTEAELSAIPPVNGPRVTVAIAAGDSTAEGAIQSLASLQRQNDENWELLLTTRTHSVWPSEALEAAARAEPRLRLLSAPDGATNHAAWLQAALAASIGGLVCFLSAGDTLAPTALLEVVAAFAVHPETQLLYTDALHR